MTVCIAATCNWLNDAPVVVAASDRMITVGDIEFEPPQSKVYELSNSIAMLISGDTAVQTELAKRASRRVNDLIAANVGWVFIEIAADIVGSCVAEHRREMTQRLFLEPFGLTQKTFLEKQAALAADWVHATTNRILGYAPGVACIVTGLDSSGAHIYTVDGYGRVVCHDAAGFAAIGSGARHAQSVMMFSGHTGRNALGDTLFLTYAAKRESEVSPGVGQGTDMFLVPQLGSLMHLPPSAFAPLERFYTEMKASESAARRQATTAMTEYLTEEIRKATAAPQPQEGDDTPAPPSEQEALPAVPEAQAPAPAPERLHRDQGEELPPDPPEAE